MDQNLYKEIFRRKSFHSFKNAGDEKLTQAEIDGIYEAFRGFEALYPDIKTEIRIVPTRVTSLVKGSEYSIMIYSEKKDNYLMNAGYLGEQLDLYLVSNNIASLWYGLGKTDEKTYNGLEYVIMFLIRKVSDDNQFRKDMYSSKRKELSEIWKGEELAFSNIVRFAPSACNSQPWIVENENNTLSVTRYRKPGRVGIMPQRLAFHFNRIDIGIFLCFMELCLMENGLPVNRELFTDNEDNEYSLVAKYRY